MIKLKYPSTNCCCIECPQKVCAWSVPRKYVYGVSPEIANIERPQKVCTWSVPRKCARGASHRIPVQLSLPLSISIRDLLESQEQVAKSLQWKMR